jgi:hypothetical protein
MFTPKISITGIPKDSSSITITDITGNVADDATGYMQAPYLPQSNTEWYKQIQVQYIAETPADLVFFPSTDNQEPGATLQYQFKDGVYFVMVFFTKQVTGLGYSLSVDLKTLTKTNADQWADPLGLFEGVYGLIKSASEVFNIEDISSISSVANTEIVLNSALTGATANDDLWVVYKVSKYILVTNDGEGKLIQDIGDMALSDISCGSGCDHEKSSSLFDRMLLKFSAQTNFACGNYVKAHNAAILLSTSKSLTETCTTCG